MIEPDLSAYPPPEPGPEMRRDAEWQRLDPRMLLVHPIREVIRFLPVLIVFAVARTAAGGRAVAAARRRHPDRARPAALPDHELPDQRRPDRAPARAAQPARAVDAGGPGPDRRPDLLADPPAARAHEGADRDRHRLDERRGPDRPRRAAAGPGPRPARRAAADLDRGRRGGRRAGAGARGRDLRPGVGAVRAADRQRCRHRRGRARCRQPAAAGGRLLRAVQPGDASTSPACRSWPCWSRCWCSASCVVVSLLSIGGYVVTNWGFRLTRTRGAATWHLTRGLFTTRETTLDDYRVAGVNLSEPLGLRLARGARLSAIVTGLDQAPAGQLLPGPAGPAAGGRAGGPRGPRHVRARSTRP